MADPLDLDLRERLEQIAAAVPVADPGQLAPVSVRVRGSTMVDRLGVSGLLPVLVLLVLGTLIAGLAQIGPFAGWPPDASGSVADVDSSGPYALELRSGRRAYFENQAIQIDAIFRYASDRSAATILSRSSLVIGFGIEEPVHGMQVATVWTSLASCSLPISRVLQPGSEILQPFEKDGTPQASGSDAGAQQAFLADPVLRLPPGVWHVYAMTSFSETDNGCDTRMMELRPVIEIEVLPTPASSTATELADEVVISRATDGLYDLEVRSARSTYYESETIDVSGVSTYTGDRAIDVSGLRSLVLSVDEPVYGITLQPIFTLPCISGVLNPGDRFEHSFVKSGVVLGSDPATDFQRAYLDDPVFRLPPGTWHIRASASFFEGSGCRPEAPKHSLSTALEIVVLPDPANQIELKTAPLPTTSDGTTVCMMARAEGTLARNEQTGLGFGGKPVTWPEGYTARVEGSRAVLIAPTGNVVAREGDRIRSGGGFGVDNTWIACGFGVIDGSSE